MRIINLIITLTNMLYIFGKLAIIDHRNLVSVKVNDV